MEGGGEENSQWVERRGGLKFHHTKHQKTRFIRRGGLKFNHTIQQKTRFIRRGGLKFDCMVHQKRGLEVFKVTEHGRKKKCRLNGLECFSFWVLYRTSVTRLYCQLVKKFYGTRYQIGFILLDQCGDWFSLPAQSIYFFFLGRKVDLKVRYKSAVHTQRPRNVKTCLSERGCLLYTLTSMMLFGMHHTQCQNVYVFVRCACLYALMCN